MPSSTVWRSSWVEKQNTRMLLRTRDSNTQTPRVAEHLAARSLRWDQYRKTSVRSHISNEKQVSKVISITWHITGHLGDKSFQKINWARTIDITGWFLHRDQRYQKQPEVRWRRPQASHLPPPLKSHGPITDRLAMITNFQQNRVWTEKVVHFLHRIVNSVRETCIQNIKSVVVVDGVCQSMLTAILTPAVSCVRAHVAHTDSQNWVIITFTKNWQQNTNNSINKLAQLHTDFKTMTTLSLITSDQETQPAHS